ncbi:hypothetical protein C9374_008787 [Naegleria lovaniensis]|uniref:Uncharacterized protein n=1 Tax=Naegleria lovaniensis TaxID=51637 RepID=A0AA88GJE2_NAELO|nr:uncharacterized protein C9374_012968 [Naegleria lovaniensis]XP_044545427.1 uncharacterized protein C9374_008787 [Naegleria lovaniensis]KAG2373025.1 hypothetical protein C9374_012968 [Naegleria lovaniensis]KAG2378165.1 hypothetical protein C9374_008787 [Naegleria lovaniensis]
MNSCGSRKALTVFSVVFEKHDDCFKFSDTYSECVGIYADEREAYIFAIRQMLKESVIEEDGEEFSSTMKHHLRFALNDSCNNDSLNRVHVDAMEDDGKENFPNTEDTQKHLCLLLDKTLSIARSPNNASSRTATTPVAHMNVLNSLMYKLARSERLNFYCLTSDELKQLHQHVLEKQTTQLCPCFSKKPSYRIYKVFRSVLNEQVAPFIRKFEPLKFSPKSFQILSDIQVKCTNDNA